MTAAAIARINALDQEGFVALLGGLYEHSPWAAERAFAKGPFPDAEALAAALAEAVNAATDAERLALIRAHPELAGDKLRAGGLTASSLSEQSGAGLDRLTPPEIAEWTRLNTTYRARQGFPFIICVRLHTTDQILEALRRRATRPNVIEQAEAIRQIHDIARLRLTDLLAKLDAEPLIGLPALEAAVKRDLSLLADPSGSWVRPTQHPTRHHVHDVVIIGGGQSGLGAAFGLRRDGVSNVLILDENPEGAEGPWVTYARMITLRTPKHLTGVETGLPSLTYRAWHEAQYGAASWEALDKIPRGQWMAYLRWLRRVLALPVRNNAHVTAITREPDGLFYISIRDGDSVLARKVVLATGIQGGGEWHTPGFIKDALPRALYAHTSEDIDFSKLAGKRIGILGAGASSFDSAQHALNQGVAETHIFVRRDRLPRINPIRHMERAGLTKRHAILPDADKYASTNHFLRMAMPPTNDTFLRASSSPGFHLHLGEPWTTVRHENGKAIVMTPKGEHAFDFLVLSTGILNDLGLRKELAAFAADCATWRDIPIQGRRNADIDAMPYLGPGFELLGKDQAATQRLRGLFLFNYAALTSLGLSAAALSGLRYAIPRLIEGVGSQLFLDDRDAILRDYFAYAEEEFHADKS